MILLKEISTYLGPSCPTDASIKSPLSADSSTSSKNTIEEDLGEGLKLRRKDLDFDDALLAAVKDNGIFFFINASAF